MDNKEFQEVRNEAIQKGIYECTSKGMKHVETHMVSFDVYEAVCYLESPFKFYRFRKEI